MGLGAWIINIKMAHYAYAYAILTALLAKRQN
jgi:hypothetical protein